MKSKTSFFNKTVFKKNLTRFAPVMAVYTLCLILGMMMLYQNNEEMGRTFWFASRIAGNLQLMGLVNLLFAPLVAMLLFGDLYNSRMCNALHALPMRRETLFLTNVVSGLLFSMIPTAVMALLSVPLLNATIVENAWQIALLWYVGTNLQFITFFGVAIFSVFCTGNRFAMAVVYAGLNGGFGGGLLFYIALAMLILWFYMRFYMYLLLVTFDLSIFKILKNSLIFSIIGFKRNFMATLGILVLVLLNYMVFVYVQPLGIVLPMVLTLACGAFMSTYAAYFKIKEIMIDPYYTDKPEESAEPPLARDDVSK